MGPTKDRRAREGVVVELGTMPRGKAVKFGRVEARQQQAERHRAEQIARKNEWQHQHAAILHWFQAGWQQRPPSRDRMIRLTL